MLLCQEESCKMLPFSSKGCGICRLLWLSFETELVKYLTETACNLEKIIFGCVDRRRSRFGVDQQYKLEKEKVLMTRALAQDLEEKLPASVEVVCATTAY